MEEIDDWRELLRIERQVLEEILIVDQRIRIDDADGVAVRRCLGAGARGDVALPAGAVVDDDRLAEALVHLLAEHAHEDVADAAGARGGDHVDRLVGVVLRRGWKGQRDERDEQNCYTGHCHPLPFSLDTIVTPPGALSLFHSPWPCPYARHICRAARR